MSGILKEKLLAGVHYKNPLSESENMRDIGFVKVEDRGGLLFKLKV
jgi:hypothetical protein